MKISELLPKAHLFDAANLTSKKAVLQHLAHLASTETGLGERLIFDKLLERERLGSTGVGSGVAIPHGRFNELDHMVAFFVKLHKKVDYDAVDDRPVDLIFLLLTPETEGSDHLQALAAISRQMRDPRLCAKIRKEKSVDALYELLTHDAQMADAL